MYLGSFVFAIRMVDVFCWTTKFKWHKLKKRWYCTVYLNAPLEKTYTRFSTENLLDAGILYYTQQLYRGVCHIKPKTKSSFSILGICKCFESKSVLLFTSPLLGLGTWPLTIYITLAREHGHCIHYSYLYQNLTDIIVL